MLTVELDPNENIVVLTPEGALSAEDFIEAANVIDPYIDGMDRLKGLIIKSRYFPGWHSLSALVTHIEFVRDHHKHLARVALVTDSALGNLSERIGRHFVSAEVRSFPYAGFQEAHDWVAQG